MSRDLKPRLRHKLLLKQFPGISIQEIAQLPIVIHLAPAITSPLTTGHVHHEIMVLLVIMNFLISSLIAASSGGETVDFALGDECGMGTYPWLVDVQEFKGILFFVFPFHVFLFVSDGIPPNVQKTVSPSASTYKERAKIEARAVLGNNEVNRGFFAIADRGAGFRVKVRCWERVGDVQGVVVVNVAICVFAEIVEDVTLEGEGWFHYKGIEIHPPEPIFRLVLVINRCA